VLIVFVSLHIPNESLYKYMIELFLLLDVCPDSKFLCTGGGAEGVMPMKIMTTERNINSVGRLAEVENY